GQFLLQLPDQLLAAEEELPILDPERVQTSERTTVVLGRGLLPQGQGTEAQIECFPAQAVNRGQRLFPLRPRRLAQLLGVGAPRAAERGGTLAEFRAEYRRPSWQQRLHASETVVDLLAGERAGLRVAE